VFKSLRRGLDLVALGGVLLDVTGEHSRTPFELLGSQYEPIFHIDFVVILSTMRPASIGISSAPVRPKGIDLPVARRIRKLSRQRGNDSGSSKSLQKALRLLLHLGEYGPEMSVTQLAGDLKLNKTTVYRLLNAMRIFELIEKDPSNERYRLGLKLHELGCRALESRSLRHEAHGFLVELSRRSHESVSLAVLGAGGIICIDRVDCLDSIITARTPVGGRFQPHCTAAGKAILAWLPDEEIRAIIKRNGMPRFTSNTVSKLADLMIVLNLTRYEGYATDNGELEVGLSGIAAPIFMRGSDLVAALGIAGPSGRFQGEELTKKIALLKDFATRLSIALGRRASELPVARSGSFYDPFS
jgi:IclR family transcriptional regulator, KDG regulon repressor